MENKETFLEKVAHIQQSLIAPKNQYNNFGKYKYRTCEDILESVKPLLGNLILLLTDEPVIIGDRFYIKSVAKITDGEKELLSISYARESMEKKGMDSAQVTGSTASYSRKYALGGLLLVDDGKDMDNENNENQYKKNHINLNISDNTEGELQEVIDYKNPQKKMIVKILCTICNKEHNGKYDKCFNCWSNKIK